MKWVEAISLKELPEGSRRKVSLGERDILLIHHQGQVYAVDSHCPHMGAPLENARLTEDNLLICPRHHSSFELGTGKVREWSPWPPVVGQLLGKASPEHPLGTYRTRTDSDTIFVELRDK